MQGSDALTNAKAPILVPLAPARGITTVTGVAPPIAVAPPVCFSFSFQFSSLLTDSCPLLQAPPSAEDEIMKARLERAELAIQKQRQRQAKEKEKAEAAAAAGGEDDGGGKVCLLLSFICQSSSDVSPSQVLVIPLILQ